MINFFPGGLVTDQNKRYLPTSPFVEVEVAVGVGVEVYPWMPLNHIVVSIENQNIKNWHPWWSLFGQWTGAW